MFRRIRRWVYDARHANKRFVELLGLYMQAHSEAAMYRNDARKLRGFIDGTLSEPDYQNGLLMVVNRSVARCERAGLQWNQERLRHEIKQIETMGPQFQSAMILMDLRYEDVQKHLWGDDQ